MRYLFLLLCAGMLVGCKAKPVSYETDDDIYPVKVGTNPVVRQTHFISCGTYTHEN